MTDQHGQQAADGAVLDAAVTHLLQGGLVAMPTETVYGLAADAENTEAIKKIYTAKQRPGNHPLIVHLAPETDLSYWASDVPDVAHRLVAAFWPGPLTLILPRASHIPETVSGGQPTIGLRCPSHPVARELLSRFARARPGGQGGLAAPSANRFGQVSPTRAEHVRAEFPELGDDVLLILDGGSAEVGIESTIVDVSAGDSQVPSLLRPGHITAADLEAVLGQSLARPQDDAPQVSGSLKAHYAPHTPLQVLSRSALEQVLSDRSRPFARVAVVAFSPVDAVPVSVSLHICAEAPGDYAQALYALMRDLDSQNFDLLLFEQPPQTPQWAAINDRLRRAAATFFG
ncbi:MAG TPA: L-threonylcarbamoyladenylate synthase [Burkholderiaceae bacterium]|nr:L-threonylcarbamoyladenylate synthase [Burkholderiaceae bacterium]